MVEHLFSLVIFDAAGPQRMSFLAGQTILAGVSVLTWLQHHTLHFQSKEGILPSDVFEVNRVIKGCLVTHHL